MLQMIMGCEKRGVWDSSHAASLGTVCFSDKSRLLYSEMQKGSTTIRWVLGIKIELKRDLIGKHKHCCPAVQ